MPGYSGTPLARKLGIKEGHRVLLVQAPKNFSDDLQGLPQDVTLVSAARGKTSFDVIVLFVDRFADLRRRFPVLQKRMQENGGFWVGWPKKASGVATDLAFDVVQPFRLSTGLVDNKICAISDVYSGLRFVIRKENRRGGKKRS